MSAKIDLSYLSEITAGDAEVMHEMIQVLTEEIPKQIDLIKQAIQQQNWSSVAAEAHRVKPSFSYIGQPELNALVFNIEQQAKQGVGLEALEEQILLVEVGYNKIAGSLRDVLKKGGS